MKKYSKEIYSKEVVLKAAYAFTDSMYIHLDADEKDYFVELSEKDGSQRDQLYLDFENELIAQENRLIVAEKTKTIREIIVARSLSSTMVNTASVDQSSTEDFNAEDILHDWFENE